MRRQRKVYAYIVYQEQILIFRHVDFPDAGLQVPGGTVDPGETLWSAVYREAWEETGLDGLRLVAPLGTILRDMREFGLSAIHERHYFLMSLDEPALDSWMHHEMTPSDGSEGPIALQFFWVSLEAVPTLSGYLGEMLPRLRARLRNGMKGL